VTCRRCHGRLGGADRQSFLRSDSTDALGGPNGKTTRSFLYSIVRNHPRNEISAQPHRSTGMGLAARRRRSFVASRVLI
jgi:hypothetical protein